MRSGVAQNSEFASHHLPLTAIPETFPVSASAEGRIYVMAKISFERIADDNSFAEVPDGFRNLNWFNFIAVDDEFLEEAIGNTNAIRTGEAAAFSGENGLAGFESPDRDNDFNLNSGYVTADNANDLKVKVFGFDDGERVAKKVLLLDQDREFVQFGAQFDDIDEVRFIAKGGTDADPNDAVAVTQSFVVDDLFIDF
jgi:hypothetical protein